MQIIVAARNRRGDVPGWVEVLIFVVIGLIVVTNKVLKAKANKTEMERKEGLTRRPPQPPQPRPAAGRPEKRLAGQPRRPSGPKPGGQYRPQVRQPGRKVVRPRPVAHKVTTKLPLKKEERGIQLPTAEPLAEPELSASVLLKESEELISKRAKKPKEKRAGVREEIPQSKYLGEILLAYGDPDELRTAILHYEILGKPMCLRGSPDSLIGL